VAGAVAVSGQVPNGSGSGGWLREIGEIRVWSLLLLELQLPRNGFRESRECFPGGGTDPRDWQDPRLGFCVAGTQRPRRGFRESRECFPGGGTDPRDWRDPRLEFVVAGTQLPRRGFRESRECFPGRGTDPRDWRDPRFGFCCWNSNCHDADSADGSGSGGWLREIGKIRRLGFF
jgi:hypothetical protein